MTREETPSNEELPGQLPDDPVPLSVVVVAKNEEDRIGACLESVFAAAERVVPAFEVVLVDSASTDRTVEIAREYPVTVLRIPEEHTVAGGAGRFVGESVVDGEMVLHVDGDMILTETWLPRAVEYLREHEDVVGVEGHLNSSDRETVETVEMIGGVMLFDGSALRSIGGFDPFLLSNEDVDVGYRLSAAGYRLVRLPEVSADHPEGPELYELVRRWRAGYYLGPGQAIRKSLSSPRVLSKFVARQRYKLLLLAWVAAGVVSAASVGLLAVWALLSMGAAAAIASRRGVRGGFTWVAAKAVGVVDLARGLRIETPDSEEYPLDAVETIEEGEVVESSMPTVER